MPSVGDTTGPVDETSLDCTEGFAGEAHTATGELAADGATPREALANYLHAGHPQMRSGDFGAPIADARTVTFVRSEAGRQVAVATLTQAGDGWAVTEFAYCTDG